MLLFINICIEKYPVKFEDHHARDQPFTLLFRRSNAYSCDYHCSKTFYHLFSEESKVLHGKSSSPPSYLEFLPKYVVIKASFDDLLLVANYCYYYICNPLTKNWLELPEPPQLSKNLYPEVIYTGFGLVCKSSSISNKQLGCSTNADYNYKVVLISGLALFEEPFREVDAPPVFKFIATIFSSDTGRWRECEISYSRKISFVPREHTDVVVSNGIMYWLEGRLEFKGIVAFDPFNEIGSKRCCFVDFPAQFCRGWRASEDRVCLGVVCGQLRLSQLFKARKSCFLLRIWELNHNNNGTVSWVLHHEARLLVDSSEMTGEMVLLALHPINGAIVFTLLGDHVCQYNILERKLESFFQHKDGYILYLMKIAKNKKFISAFTLVHPPWPTPILPLLSS
ncbi:hypothetical protein UlMin_012150 [Ulmus minor]